MIKHWNTVPSTSLASSQFCWQSRINCSCPRWRRLQPWGLVLVSACQHVMWRTNIGHPTTQTSTTVSHINQLLFHISTTYRYCFTYQPTTASHINQLLFHISTSYCFTYQLCRLIIQMSLICKKM